MSIKRYEHSSGALRLHREGTLVSFADHEAELAALHERTDRAEAELAVLRNNQLGPVPEGPLKALGAWIADHTDDDTWPDAERYLNAALAEMETMRAHDRDGERWQKLVSLATQWPQTVLVVNINIGHDWHTADTPAQIADVVDAAIAAEGER